MKKRSLYITYAAMTAALYTVLTLLSYFFGLDKGIFQIRLSEVLTVLPVFSPAAVPGLFVGCILSGLITSALPLDIFFGSIATFLGACGTYIIGKKSKYLSVISPIAANTVAVPFILKYAYKLNGGLPFFFVSAFVSELITAGILGAFLIKLILNKKYAPKA